MKLSGLLIKAGVRTSNGVVFTKAAIESMHSSGAKKAVRRQLVGRLVGPANLAPAMIKLRDVAVVVTDLLLAGNGTELHAEVETLGTPKGLDVVRANEVIEEAKKGGKTIGRLVLKPRGTGTVDENGEVGDDYVLEAVDLFIESVPTGISMKEEEKTDE